MKEIKKKALLLSALGCILGFTIGVVLWIIGMQGELSAEENIRLLILYLVVSGIYGMLAMGTSVVYDIESWSIMKATAVHFVVTLLGFYALGMLEGWLKFGDVIFFIMTVAFVVIYVIIWLVQYLSLKHSVANLNRQLEEMKTSEKDE